MGKLMTILLISLLYLTNLCFGYRIASIYTNLLPCKVDLQSTRSQYSYKLSVLSSIQEKIVQFSSINAHRNISKITSIPAHFAPLSAFLTITIAASKIQSNLLLMPSLFLFVLSYGPCLLWGIPKTSTGSWRSKVSNLHRFGGIATLLLPLLATLYESILNRHVNVGVYLMIVSTIMCNISFGCQLIPKRIPAYDVPTTRAFAVGVLLGLSFTTLSLFYRFGHLSIYRIPGIIFAFLAIYTNIYAWSDGLQHLRLYIQGHYKSDIGKKWFLPFEKSTYKSIFLDALTKQPSKDGLAASVSPSNIVTVSTTILTAIFALISLLQVRYLWLGVDGMIRMREQYPEVVRWSTYEALLAVVANNFGTFAGTLVLHNKVSQRDAGMYNAVGLMIPVLNVIGFCMRSLYAAESLIAISKNMF